VSTAAWFPQVEGDVRNKYLENARVLLSVRCCGIESFFQAEPVGDLAVVEKDVVEAMSECSRQRFHEMWVQFLRGDKKADFVLEDLLQILPTESCDAAAQVDGYDATHVQDRVLPRSHPLNKLAALITDPERRAAWQLALLQRFPMTWTPCCQAQVCFRCKTYGWHHETCQERQRQEVGKEVRFCPHCGVPTIKSEGCDHMVCVCGRDWNWATHPLVFALQNPSLSEISALLEQLEDINAPLYGAGESPVNYFLTSNSYQNCSVANQILTLFAAKGAIACPRLHHEHLLNAVRENNATDVKFLLESFVGVTSNTLTEMLEESISRNSKRNGSSIRAAQHDDIGAIMSSLIERGAVVSDVASQFHLIQHKIRCRLPEEIVKMFENVRGVAVQDLANPVEHKLQRSRDQCTIAFRKQKHQAHMDAKLGRMLTKMMRPRGGKHKVGLIEIEC
jgi:hypothetical protein